jgi:hypothetical protein
MIRQLWRLANTPIGGGDQDPMEPDDWVGMAVLVIVLSVMAFSYWNGTHH